MYVSRLLIYICLNLFLVAQHSFNLTYQSLKLSAVILYKLCGEFDLLNRY